MFASAQPGPGILGSRTGAHRFVQQFARQYNHDTTIHLPQIFIYRRDNIPGRCLADAHLQFKQWLMALEMNPQNRGGDTLVTVQGKSQSNSPAYVEWYGAHDHIVWLSDFQYLNRSFAASLERAKTNQRLTFTELTALQKNYFQVNKRDEQFMLGAFEADHSLLQGRTPLFSSMPAGFLYQDMIYAFDVASREVYLLEKVNPPELKSAYCFKTVPFNTVFNCPYSLGKWIQDFGRSVFGVPYLVGIVLVAFLIVLIVCITS